MHPTRIRFSAPPGCLPGATQYRHPADLSLIIGDTVRNLSAALDYLVWELVGGDPAAGGRGATSTGFPIFVDPGSYEARALKKIRGIPPSAEAVIKRLQPFERSDFPETDPLALLYVLEQRDKHRTLNLTTIMGSVYITEGGVRADDLGGVQFAFGPVEQDAVICHARRGVLNRHMEVYLHVAYYVAFDYEWPVGGRNILELLDEIRRDIRVNVLPLFDQFFPLP